MLDIMKHVTMFLVVAAMLAMVGAAAAVTTVEQTDVSVFEFSGVAPGDEVSIHIDGMVETPEIMTWTGEGISSTVAIDDVVVFYDLSEFRVGSLIFANGWAGYGVAWGRNGDSVGYLDMGDITPDEQYTMVISGLPYADETHVFMDFTGFVVDGGDGVMVLPVLPAGEYTIDVLVNGELCVTTTNARGTWVACSFYSDTHTYEEYRVGDPVIEDAPKSRIETVLASRGRVAAMVQR